MNIPKDDHQQELVTEIIPYRAPELGVAPRSASEQRRFVTVVYEITDEAAWRSGGNPLHYDHHGLKSVCVSAGDLATFNEEIEAEVKDGDGLTEEKFDALFKKHVLSSGSLRWQSKSGKRLLRQLPADLRLKIADFGSSISAQNSVPWSEAWKIDKRKTEELKRDGSNFFQIAERIT